MRALIAALSISLLSSCATAPQDDIPSLEISRRAFVKGFFESTPVIFQGQPLIVSFSRSPDGTKDNVVQFRTLEANLIGEKSWTDRNLGCALVVGNVLYLFASNSSTSQTDIAMVSTIDLVNFTAPVTVLTSATHQKIWNCSVAPDGTGFVMAYEVSEPDFESFSFRFAKSADLVNWTRVGVRYDNKYSACPTIRAIDGVYYVFYLEPSNGKLRTRAARSTDLVNFEKSKKAVVSPDADEGVNTSDVDYMELNGQVVLTYIDGDQMTWGDLKLGVYEGTIAEMLTDLFN